MFVLVFILIYSIFFSFLNDCPPVVTGVEPGFISPLHNMTVAAGRSAHFTCVVKHLGGHKVRIILFKNHWAKYLFNWYSFLENNIFPDNRYNQN